MTTNARGLFLAVPLAARVLWPGPAHGDEPRRALAPLAPVNVVRLHGEAFDALSQDAKVEVGGRVLTKKQFLAEMLAKRAAAVQRKPPNANVAHARDAGFQALRTRALSAQTRKIETTNAATQAKMASLFGAFPVTTPTPDPCTNPKITVMSVAPPVTPGEELIVNGCGFGPKAGELRLVGDFPPVGYVKLQIIKPWSGYALVARIPPVSGAMDQSASQLQVVTSDYRISQPQPLAFEATREVVGLNKNDVTMTCEGNSQYDKCPRDDIELAPLSAEHDAPAVLNAGTDTARLVPLKNGYVFAGYGWEWYGVNGYVVEPTGFDEGSTNVVGRIGFACWRANGDWGWADYRFWLYVVGPVGVPYR